MALYPKIQSPCPYKDNLAAIMDGDVCRMCKRQVFDLNGMDDDQKVAFFGNCKGEVCVRYTFPVRPAIAAAALAAAVIAVPTAAAACSDPTQEEVIMVGGMRDTGNVKFAEDPRDKNIPELPVVYEKTPGAKDATKPAQRTDKTAPSSRV